jgi:uracil-DNA glycosylase
MFAHMPPDWRAAIAPALASPQAQQLERFVEQQRQAGPVFPPPAQVFTALHLTPPHNVRVVLLGQDPYHDDGQAHGLCFSVPRGVAPPPSLRNMFTELEADLGLPRPSHGDLTAWAAQGVLLLNTVLTVRAHEPASHARAGWEPITNALLTAVVARATPVVVVLWGNHAQKKAPLFQASHVTVLQGPHPSPLSAYRGFFGSRPFSAVNAALAGRGLPPVDWKLPA